MSTNDTLPLSKPIKRKRYYKKGRKKKVVTPIRKKGKGRPELGWPTYEEAKALVRARGIKSMTEYKDWHKRERIKFLPGYPYRVYVKEWVSWGEFLGSNNEFMGTMKKREYRAYWDAVRWVQASGIGTWAEWKVAYAEGRVPSDIPKWPYVEYSEFDAEVWFGKNVMVKLDARDRETMVWCLVHMEGEPANVVWFLKVGMNAIKQDWKVMRVWQYEADLEKVAWTIVERMSSMYYDTEQRMCTNVSAMMFELDRELLIVKV